MSDQRQELSAIILRLLEIATDLDRWQTQLQSEHIDGPGRKMAETQKVAMEHADLPAVAAELLRTIDQRGRFMDPALFADPAWCLLLDLYIHDAKNRTVSVSSACIAARVPPTTALRWISLLVDRGLIQRTPDALDARRIHIKLTEDAKARLSACLLEIAEGRKSAAASAAWLVQSNFG